jgi:sphingolipid C9-methyltransferase
LVKNINSTHRVEGIATQFGLSGALASSKVDMKANAIKNAASQVQDKASGVISGQ